MIVSPRRPAQSSRYGRRWPQLLAALALLAILGVGGPFVPVGALAAPPGTPAAGGGITVGEPGPDADGTAADPRALPDAPRGETPSQAREVPAQRPDPAAFGRAKAAANANAASAGHRPGTGGGAVAPPAQFPGLGYGDTGGWNPPDAALAAGPTSLLVAVNEAFTVYDKGGAVLLPAKGLGAFFGTGDSVFDPRALYDAGNGAIVNGSAIGYNGGGGRFVMLATTVNNTTRTSSFLLAISQGGDPRSAATGWCTYRLNAVTGSGNSAAWADYPGLGMDGDNLYLTSNQFTFGNNAFQYARLLVVPKASVYPTASNGKCGRAASTGFANLKQPDGSAAFTVQPASQPDALPRQASTTTLYFVNSLWNGGTSLVARAVTVTRAGTSTQSLALNPPQWVGVADYDVPAAAPQPSGGDIETGDARLLGAVQRYGTIYTANTTQHVATGNYAIATIGGTTSATPNPYANAQWYVLRPTGPTAYQSPAPTYAVADPDVAYYFPGVIPGCTSGGAGGSCATPFAAIEVSGSSATVPASAYRARGGQLPAPYQTGSAGYTLNARWGDYPALASDPQDPATVWLLGQYAAASGAWGTAIEHVTPSIP
jgi:hypothetical protein